MQIISSYGVELRKQNIPIRQTLEIYRSAVSYLIGIYVQVWEKLAEIPDAKRRFNAAEHLVHTTKKNHACFDFNIRFPKMPSYLRRSAIRHALGTVSSYKTRLDLWEKTDGKSGKPRLVYENHAMPVFYRDVMYREGAERKEDIGPCVGKETPPVFSSFFLYRRSNTDENTGKRTDHLQCGSGNQY